MGGIVQGMSTEEVTRLVIENVRRLIAAKIPPWSQRELARRIGIEPGASSRLLSGNHAPSLDTLAKLATVLEVPIHELLMPNAATPAKSDPTKKPAGKKPKGN